MDMTLADAIASANAAGVDGRLRSLYYALIAVAAPDGQIPRVRRGMLAQMSGRSSVSIASGLQDLVESGALVGGGALENGYLTGGSVRVFRAAKLADEILQSSKQTQEFGAGFDSDPLA